MVFCKWKNNYFCYSKQEKLGSAGEFGFADCMFRQFYFKRGFWGKVILLQCWSDFFFSPLAFFKERKDINTGVWVILLSGFVFFFLKLCTSIKESGGVSCVFLDHVPASF